MSCHTPTIYNFDTPLEQKRFLRKRAKDALKEYCADSALMESASLSALKSVTESQEYKNAEYFLGFMPMKDELDILPLMKQALKDGKKVFIPRMAVSGNQMDFYQIQDFDTSFTEDNPYHIKEPSETCQILDVASLPENSFICVPGLVFNLEGARLGRGKGYYDTFLHRLLNYEKQVLCGVCFTICVTKAIPMEEHDLTVNHLLNEYGFISLHR